MADHLSLSNMNVIFNNYSSVHNYCSALYKQLCKLLDNYVLLRIRQSGRRETTERPLVYPRRWGNWSYKSAGWKSQPSHQEKMLFDAMSWEAHNAVRCFLMCQEDQLLKARPRKFSTLLLSSYTFRTIKFYCTRLLFLLVFPGNICTMFSYEFAKNFSNSSFMAKMNGDSSTLPYTSASLSIINIDLFKKLAH